MHAPGVDAFIQGICEKLALAGFAAIAPDLYHRESEEQAKDEPLVRMGRLKDAEIAKDINAALQHLCSYRQVARDRVGIIGFCMGGRIAYMMAALNPSFRACVDFYGGNIAVPWGEGPSPLDLTPQIGCPVLGLFGAEDANPSPQDVARMEAELRRNGKEYQFHIYPGAGHAFMNEARPSYRPEAAQDAWQRCTAFLSRHLMPSTG